MNLQSTDFELFDVPERFAQDRAVLDARWKQLQSEVHPDRFASQGAAAQRVALQWSVRINEAYQRLKDPLRRAIYLCERHGAPVEAESNTAMPADFLMRQMAWREALDEVDGVVALDTLADEVQAERRRAFDVLAQQFDEQADYVAAAKSVRALMFIARFSSDIEARYERLGQ